MLASSSRALPSKAVGHAHRSTARTLSTALVRRSSSKSIDQQRETAETPSMRTKLLLECLPLVPEYGFSRQTFLSRTSVPLPSMADGFSAKGDSVDRGRILDTLFPGPESVFEGELFKAWNQVQDLQAIYQTSPQYVSELRLSGSHPEMVFNGADAGRTRVEMRSSLSDDEAQKALQNVQEIVEDRLRSSWNVKQHLIQGITVLSSFAVSTSSLHAVFPHRSVLPSLPNPTPMLALSSDFIGNALTNPAAQTRTGWLDSDSTDWYAVRGRLTSAYLLTTLHISSGQIAHFEDSQRFFRRIMMGRDSGLAATIGSALDSRNQWLTWGGRGWVGVLRSLGL